MKAITGTVVSAKNDKTIIVEVVNRWQHPLYKKVVKRSKKYAAHDENNTANEGDVVSIESCRPMSKRKKWQLVSNQSSK